jgi:hypothetical protein
MVTAMASDTIAAQDEIDRMTPPLSDARIFVVGEGARIWPICPGPQPEPGTGLAAWESDARLAEMTHASVLAVACCR